MEPADQPADEELPTAVSDTEDSSTDSSGTETPELPPDSSDNAGLDPDYTAALTNAESHGDPNAVSTFIKKDGTKGHAYGSRQILESTFNQYKQGDESFSNDSDRTKASDRFLQHLFDKYDDPRLVSAAYNAGEGRVDGLLQKSQSGSFDEIEPHLPAETRGHVAKVDAFFQKLKSGKEQNDPEEPDFTDKYNTKLSDSDEAKFQEWAQKNNRLGDLFDYDMRGFWKSGDAQAANGHFPDTYKKPNHPTFSNESQYDGSKLPDGSIAHGGSWDGDKFIPPADTPEPAKGLNLVNAARDLPPTKEGFAQAAISFVTDPAYDSLPFDQKINSLANLYDSKKWNPDVYNSVKTLAQSIWDESPPDERPSIAEMVGAPPIVQPDQDPAKVLAVWKQDAQQELLRKGVSTALFGDRLDQYLNSAADEETQAFNTRNRGPIGSAFHYGINFGEDIARGVASLATKPVAGIARLASGGALSDTADAIENLPDWVLGKASRDYLYVTNPDGSLQKDADGQLIPRWSSGVAQAIGNGFGLIAGVTELKTAGYGGAALFGAIFSENSLSIANDEFKSVLNETGDTKKAYTASLFALPAAMAGSLPELAVVSKWANPSLKGLGNFNRARYMASVATRNAAVAATGGVGQDLIAQAGENVTTGKPFSGDKVAQAALGSAIAGGGFSALAARGAEPVAPPASPDEPSPQLALPAPEQRLGLPAPPERLGLPNDRANQRQLGTDTVIGPEEQGRIYGYEPTSPADQVAVAAQLEKFQRSPDSQIVLTKDDVRNMDPDLMSVLQFEVAPTEDGGAIVSKKETYVPVDSDELQTVRKQVADLNRYLSDAPSPDKMYRVVDERSNLKRELGEQSAGINGATKEALGRRQELQSAFDEAKRNSESQSSQTLKQVADLELDDARQNLIDFDNAHEGLYDAAQTLGPMSERIDQLTEQLKDGLSPTYVNDLKAKERNLQNLLQKQKDLEANQAREANPLEPVKEDSLAGVTVDNHSVLPVNKKWYVVDPAGKLLGRGHDFFSDAVDSIREPTREGGNAQFQTEIPSKDRTALTPEDNRTIADRVKAEKAVRDVQASTREAALKFRDTLHAKEDAAARVQSKKEDNARQGIKAKEKVPQVQALEGDAVRGLEGDTSIAEDTVAKDTTSKESPPADVTRDKLGIDQRSRQRLQRSTARKPLTSDYTQPHYFTEKSTKEVPVKRVYNAAQKLLSSVSKDLKIFPGSATPKNVLGFINATRDYIVTGRSNDPVTLIHETKHGIDRAVIGKWDPAGIGDYSHIPLEVIKAAQDMADTFYGRKLNSDNLRIQEGLAMFFQHYASGQPYRQEVGDWYHNSFGKEFPKIYKAMEEIKNLSYDYFEQTPETYEKSRFVPDNTKGVRGKIAKVVKWSGELNSRYLDTDSLWRKVDRALAQHDVLYKAKEVNRNRAKSVAGNWMNYKLTDFNGNVLEGMTFEEAKAPGEGIEKDVQAYMLAMNDAAHFSKGLQRGGNLKDALKTIDKYKSDPTSPVPQIADNIWKWWHKTDDVIAGASPEMAYTVAKMRKANLDNTGAEHGYYVPRQVEGYSGFSPSARVKGTSKAGVVDPFSNYERVLRQKVQAAFNSQQKYALFNAFDKVGPSSIGLYMREVTGYERNALIGELKARTEKVIGRTPENADLITEAIFGDPLPGVTDKKYSTLAFIDSKSKVPVRLFEVDPKIAASFNPTIAPILDNPLFKYIIRPSGQVMRVTATTFRGAFQIKNIWRDQQTAYRLVKSGDGFTAFQDATKLLWYTSGGIVDRVTGHNIAGMKPYNDAAKALGLADTNRLSQVNNLRDELSAKYGKNFLDVGEEGIRKIESFLSIPESATRTAAMRFAADRLGIKNIATHNFVPEESAELIAAFARGSTSFGRQGSDARVINMIAPFFTARINEITRLPGDLRANPARFAAISLGWLAYGAYHAIAHSDQQWYQELTPESWVGTPVYKIVVDGVEKVLMLPIDDLAQLNFGVGQLFGHKMTEDPHMPTSYFDWARAYFGQHMPVNSWTDLLGPVGKEVLSQQANWDYYFNKKIVPPSLEEQPSKSQYTELTSELSKRVANMIGVSPMRLDHAVHSIVPAVSDADQFIERQLGLKKGKEYSSNNFLVAALTRSGSASGIMDRSQRDFTDQLLKFREAKPDETFQDAAVRKKLEKINKDVSDLNTFIVTIDDQELKDQMRQKKRDYLRLGISIAQGGEDIIPPTGVSAEAKQIRKARSTHQPQP